MNLKGYYELSPVLIALVESTAFKYSYPSSYYNSISIHNINFN